jgi:protein gp37
MGTTVDCQERVANAEKAFAKMGGGIKWLSIEPMLTPLKFTRLDLFDWVVIGGASRSAHTPAWVPPFDWIADLHAQARAAGCAVYHKDNLGLGGDVRLKEFPWEPRADKELPEALKYLSMK